MDFHLSGGIKMHEQKRSMSWKRKKYMLINMQIICSPAPEPITHHISDLLCKIIVLISWTISFPYLLPYPIFVPPQFFTFRIQSIFCISRAHWDKSVIFLLTLTHILQQNCLLCRWQVWDPLECRDHSFIFFTVLRTEYDKICGLVTQKFNYSE